MRLLFRIFWSLKYASKVERFSKSKCEIEMLEWRYKADVKSILEVSLRPNFIIDLSSILVKEVPNFRIWKCFLPTISLAFVFRFWLCSSLFLMKQFRNHKISAVGDSVLCKVLFMRQNVLFSVPAAVESFRIVDVNSTSVTFNWNELPGTRYNISLDPVINSSRRKKRSTSRISYLVSCDKRRTKI